MATSLHITYARMDSYESRWISPRWPGGFCRDREKAELQRGCERAFYFASRCQSLDCKFGEALGGAVVRAHAKPSGSHKRGRQIPCMCLAPFGVSSRCCN